ncbi:MAG: prepilin-type N-terminal cleavage/methylation domain-containing protein [Planctomycetes bacterium]|nr:prepilin-type N-terminal cleavage/methylation domain-containing protein [Planctomycetota bacterium]
MRASQRPAFTLLELLLVIVLVGVLAAFAWPNLGTAARAEELEESARRIKALTAMCRAQAMNESRRYRITIRLDGTLKTTRQHDPLTAPHEYIRVRAGWARIKPILDEVWVEAVLPLPEGPPPILLEKDETVVVGDEILEFDDMDLEPLLLEDFDEPIEIDFELDGSCSSLRWILRDTFGRGLQMTLDGRLGRTDVAPVESLPRDQVQRPEREPVEDEDGEFVEESG